MNVIKTIIINSSPEEVYSFWHNYENFQNFIENVESVTKVGPKTFRWKAKGVGGISAECERKS